MNLYQAISFPLYVGGVLEIILGIALLKKTPRKSRAMRACAALFFAAAAYVLCNAISFTLESQGRDYNFFNRASWIGWFMIPAGLQFAYYMQNENSRAARIAGYVLYPFWSLVFALTMFTDLVEPGDPSLIPFIDIDGPLEKPARLIGALMAIWLLVALYRAEKRMTGAKKTQFILFFYGTLFFNVGCILVAGILPIFGAINPAYTTFFSLPWVIITYYAITRDRFFDLRRFISRALTITLVLSLFSVIHILLFELFSPVLGDTLAILLSLSMIGMLFFGTRLSRSMRQRIERLILKDRYDYQVILRECTRAIGTILDLGELLSTITSSMKKGLGSDHICIALREGHGVRYETGAICPVDDIVIDWLGRTGQVVVKEEFEYARPDDAGAMVYAYMKKTGAELLIPLLYKGEIKGYIILGLKGNGDPYVQSDIPILEALAGQAAVAIENARLYEESLRSKESMQESEAKFRTLAETAAIGIFIHQGGNFLYANRAAEVIGGYTVDEYLTMNFMGLVHPDYIDLVKTRARERLGGRGEMPMQYEFKIVKKNGEERWVLMTAGITEYDRKNTVMGTLIDITDRKRAEEERELLYAQLQKALLSLKESEARFRILAETTSAGIFIHRGKKFIYANPAIKYITGFNADEFLVLDFWSVVHPDYRDLVRERGRARLQGAQVPPEYEVKIIIKNGEERWGNLTVGIIDYEGEPAVIATFFDITDRKRAEEERAALYEQRIAEEKRHVWEKEKLLMDLHDGIGGITTNISILAEMGQQASDIEGIKKMLSTISRLSREGISEIRGFMHGLDRKELNWRTLAAELKIQGTTLMEPHRITFTFDSSMEEIDDQPGSLLWVNLFKIYKEALTNVIKHAKADTATVTLNISRSGLQLAIQDNGVGWENKANGGRGVSNMHKRAGEIGAEVLLSSSRGGTRVNLNIPLPLKYPTQGMES
jgi:PAS domain S-box-containing protein